jgi:hypothetical protein
VRLPYLHEGPVWESRRAARSAASALGPCALVIVSPSGQESRLKKFRPDWHPGWEASYGSRSHVPASAAIRRPSASTGASST